MGHIKGLCLQLGDSRLILNITSHFERAKFTPRLSLIEMAEIMVMYEQAATLFLSAVSTLSHTPDCALTYKSIVTYAMTSLLYFQLSSTPTALIF